MTDNVFIQLSLLNDKRLSYSDVKVYAAIKSLVGENNQLLLTKEEIKRGSGVERVSRHTCNLTRYGYIQIMKEGNRNIYKILGNTEEERGQIYLQEFMEEYLVYSSGIHSPKSYITNRTALREFLRKVGNRALNSIGTKEIEHFLSIKKQEASEWTSRKYYGSLAAAFEKAIHWEYIDANPFRKVKKPKPPETQPVYFLKEEIEILISNIKENDFRDLILTDLLTGLRLGELLSLRWMDVNFSTKTIQVRNSEIFTTKSRKNRIVPMSELLYRFFEKKKYFVRNESEFIFHDKRGRQLKESTISQKFKRYVRRANLNDKLHFHSLRHSFATHMIKNGVPLFAIQKLLGHASSKTTEIYSHMLPEQLHREVNVLPGVFQIEY